MASIRCESVLLPMSPRLTVAGSGKILWRPESFLAKTGAGTTASRSGSTPISLVRPQFLAPSRSTMTAPTNCRTNTTRGVTNRSFSRTRCGTMSCGKLLHWIAIVSLRLILHTCSPKSSPTPAFSHSGYTTGSSKSAIASDLAAHEFSVINLQTGQIVLTKPVEQASTPLGNYQVLDFSAVREPGTYVIKAGDTLTRSFRIGDDAWLDSIWKSINFMYSERCGTEIPGIHGRCHQDIYTIHDDKRIVVNGGYHDAGDLSATGNTPGMVYALLSLADNLKRHDADPVLSNRLLEEARWGLNWVLKTRFGDGFRSTGQLVSYWTDGIMGDSDDRFGQAVNNPEWNFRVSGVEALAARVLKDTDPELANRRLKIAEEDWKFAVEGLKTAPSLAEVYGAQDELERISFGVVASVEVYLATGDDRYAQEAIVLGDLVLSSQERILQQIGRA